VGPESVCADVLLGAAHEGPPGRVHGGWVAAVLDHVLGRATAAAGFPGMTASLTVDYHHGTPYAVPLTAEGRLVRRDGRKLHAAAMPVYCMPVTAAPITRPAARRGRSLSSPTVNHSAAVAATTAMTTESTTVVGSYPIVPLTCTAHIPV